MSVQFGKFRGGFLKTRTGEERSIKNKILHAIMLCNTLLTKQTCPHLVFLSRILVFLTVKKKNKICHVFVIFLVSSRSHTCHF